MPQDLQKNGVATRAAFDQAQILLETGRDLINRSYLADLGSHPVQAFDSHGAPFKASTDVRIFRIERIVHENKQSVLESATAAYTALGAAGHAVFLLLTSDGAETLVHIGARGAPGKTLGQNAGDLLRESFKGHFSGSDLRPLNGEQTEILLSEMKRRKEDPSASVTAVTGVPSLSTENREHFMQGLERFIDAAEGRTYQALILAEPISSANLDLIQRGYEEIATQLSPWLKQQRSYGEQESESVGLNLSRSLSESLGRSLALTETRDVSQSLGFSKTQTIGVSDTRSRQTGSAQTASLLGVGGGAALGGVLGGPIGAGFGAQLGGTLANISFGEQKTTGTNASHALGTSESRSTSDGFSRAATTTTDRTTSLSEASSHNATLGASRQISIEFTNKGIERLLARIDGQFKRIEEAKAYGAWSSAAYFIGEGAASSEVLASIFLGLMRGGESSREDFALTTWSSKSKAETLNWLSALTHPRIQGAFPQTPVAYLSPATLVSGKEMAVQMSLPRRSTSTISVVETQAFGRKVQRLDQDRRENRRLLSLGSIRHLWENLPQELHLDLDQITSHVFVSGATGSGKSNALYEILRQVSEAGTPFLVIEPAKGEYKRVFGGREDVRVFGTNPEHGETLRLNPFGFPQGIHVLEHVDRLIEIFNLCWPMYAAMPAVLKEALLLAYQEAGWDLELSRNRLSSGIFPTFVDLLEALERRIEASAYSQEVKSNYAGSLTTRVRSLTNGLNGRIFAADEIDAQTLFESNVVVDLSRVGSSETKALIMGLLVMRLNEHRLAKGEMDQPLRHVTVLEEAHHILRRDPTESGAEGAGLAGKSVEMLTNAIAEMRSYGEGFIIVDQSPQAVDPAAIRNTGTKIIMRLPDEADRRLIGKSAAVRDNQLEEIARFPRGVALIHQSDWLEPVLCQIRKFSGEARPYIPRPQSGRGFDPELFKLEALEFLLADRVCRPKAADLERLEAQTRAASLPAWARIALLDAILERRRINEAPSPERPANFEALARLVAEILGYRREMRRLAEMVGDPEGLHDELRDFLARSLPETREELRLAAEQCLVRDWCQGHPDPLKIYAGWNRRAQEKRKP